VTVDSLWQILELAPTGDETAIRRAYAQKLKRIRPEEDATGFARLRAAYEQALRMARSAKGLPSPTPAQASPAPLEGPDAVPVAVEPPSSVWAPVTAPAATPSVASAPDGPATSPNSAAAGAKDAPQSSVEDLRRAYLHLQQLIRSPSAGASELCRALDACFHAPALTNLQTHLQFESSIANLLKTTQPRAECLLEPTIAHFGWRNQAGVGRPDLLRGLVSYADSVRVLANARSASPRALAAITKAPRPLILRSGILFARLDTRVRELLGEIGAQMPVTVHPGALEWWQRYFGSPQIRPELLWVGLAFTVLAGLIGLSAAPAGHVGSYVLGYGLLGALLGGVLACGVFWGIDWPRHKLRTTRRVAHIGIRLGWAPTALGLCFLAALTPSNGMTITAFAALSAANAAWAVVMALEPVGGKPLLRLYGLLVTNIPLVAWCAMLSNAPASIVTYVMWPTLLGALIAFGLGHLSLVTAFIHDLFPARQQRIRIAICTLAVVLILLMLWRVPAGTWNSLVFIAMFGLVLAQRTAASNLNEKQFRMRYGAGLISIFLLRAAQLDTMQSAATLRIGSFLFMGGVLATMLASLYNARRSSALSAMTA
jgi:hypothetical protein